MLPKRPVSQIQRSRELRREMTDAERTLWQVLRRDALGVRFRRQQPFGPYILDFACLETRLVIEVDGGQHLDNDANRRRDAFLAKEGYRVLRSWNNEVLQNIDGVTQVLHSAIVAGSDKSPPPDPTPTPPLAREGRLYPYPPQGGGIIGIDICAKETNDAGRAERGMD
jgi:very-short-patch-repair endonuclease